MVVRNSWVTQGKEAAGFIDAADFEEVKRQGDQAIRGWINNQLKGTSVTVVLVGAETCDSRWVAYEIERSIEIGNGLLGIDVSKIKDLQGNTSKRCGEIPKATSSIIGTTTMDIAKWETGLRKQQKMLEDNSCQTLLTQITNSV